MAKHRIVEEYITASDTAQAYLDDLNAQILRKGFVGEAVDKKTIDNIANFLHSDDVAKLIRAKLGSKAGNYSNEELLQRYGITKHQIEQTLKNQEAITPGILEQLTGQLSVQLHGELTRHHPAAIADWAYDKGIKAGQDVLTQLYKVSGGPRYVASHKKEITNLTELGPLADHVGTLYQRLTLHQERQRTHVAKPSKK